MAERPEIDPGAVRPDINPGAVVADKPSTDGEYDASEYQTPIGRARRLAREIKQGKMGPYGFAGEIAGAGEAMLSQASGAAGAVVGGLRGLWDTATSNKPDSARAAEKVRETQKAMTYEPRSLSGRVINELLAAPTELASYVGGVEGKAMGSLVGPQTALAMESVGEAVPGVAGAILGGRAAMPGARAMAQSSFPRSLGRDVVTGKPGAGPMPAGQPANPAPIPMNQQPQPITGQPGRASVGAANVPAAQVATDNAAQLGAPRLMASQIPGGKTPDRWTTMKEAAKREGGEPIAQRIEEQQQFIPEYMDRLIDSTEPRVPLDAYSFGTELHGVATRYMDSLRGDIRQAYKKADNSPEAQMPVDVQNLQAVFADLEKQGILESVTKQAPILGTVRAALAKALEKSGDTGPAILGPDGKPLRAPQQPQITVRQAEEIRKTINAFTDIEADSVNYRQGSVLKRALDSDLENAGGDLYKNARRLRREFGERFEDNKQLADLVKMKGGDHKIPLEQVFNRLVANGNHDSIVHMRRVLREADPTNQIWNEVQAQVLNDVMQQVTSNRTPTSTGQYTPSMPKFRAAMKKWEQGGKLDTILGKETADKLRSLYRYGEDALVDIAGNYVNRSNTAAALDPKGILGSLIDTAEKHTRMIPGAHAIADKVKKGVAKSAVERVKERELNP